MVRNPSLAAGVDGQAMFFDGSDQSVDLGRHGYECFGNLSLCTQGYTLLFWFKYGTTKPLYSPNIEYYYISNGGQTKYSFGVAVFQQKGRFSSSCRLGNGTLWRSSTDMLDVTNWNHVTLTWRMSHGLRIFINGSLAQYVTTKSKVVPPQEPTENAYYIGRPSRRPKSNVNYGEFTIDEFFFWESELEMDMILKIYEKYWWAN